MNTESKVKIIRDLVRASPSKSVANYLLSVKT